MSQDSDSRLLSLPRLILDEIIWEVFQVSSFRDWLKLRLVCSTLSYELQWLLHTRDPLDDIDHTKALHIPTWCAVSASMMPNDMLTQYCAKRALAPGHRQDPLDYYTLRVADTLMPVIQAQAVQEDRKPPTLPEVLPAFYDYMIWPGRYNSHRSWQRRAIHEHLPVSVASCAALFGLTEFTLNAIRAEKERNPDHFATRFDNVLLNAALGGHVDLFKELHDLGVKPQRHLDPDTLACAAWSGTKEIVAFLLENDYNTNDTRNVGPPIQAAAGWAARAGHEDIIDMLITHWSQRDGASRDGSISEKWYWILFEAVRAGHTHIVRRAVAEDAESCVNVAGLVQGSVVSCLEVAAIFGRTAMVPLLIEAGALTRPLGHVDVAIQRAAKHGHVETMLALTEYGLGHEWQGLYSAGPISWMQAAAASGEDRVVRMLIEERFDAANDGVQAAQIAAANGYVTVVKMLIAAGVDAGRVEVAAREHGQWHVASAIEELRTGRGVLMS